jgi:hypothetical protein
MIENEENYHKFKLDKLDLNKDYFEIKNIIQKYKVCTDKLDFFNQRLNYEDNKTFNLNYGTKAWYAGFYLESFRNSYKAYLQTKNENHEEHMNLALSNIKFCDNVWNKEKIEYLDLNSFFEPYHHYLKMNDIYVFTYSKKNILREFVWKVCYQASIINPYWTIIFMDYDKDDIYFYFETEKNKFVKYIISNDDLDETKQIKDLLSLKKCEKESDKMTLLALSNFLIVNSSFYN